jgi:tetratricopeptide (TPR) repeat protein
MIESYPLIDKAAGESINQALELAQGGAGPANREEAIRALEQWVKILQQASDLPPTNRDSRIVIARAATRLGYARALLSMAKATPNGLEPGLLAQATKDYSRSIDQFDHLLAESPGDPKLLRYLADAAGIYGLGCCFRFANRDGDAESYYHHAIQLRRGLVRGPRSGGVPNGARADVTGEADNFCRLVDTVQILAAMEEGARRRAEAEDLLRQLEDDVKAMAARFSGPESEGLRSMLAQYLLNGLSASTADGRRLMIQRCRWALVLNPEHPFADNNLAWALASAPDDPWFDPKQALDLARKAVKRTPHNGECWNTLGVAAFRLRDWGTAAESFRKSNQINGGTGIDCFFLAMTCWHQGKRDEARQWFDQAVAFEKTRSEDLELRRFHVEAAALLGLPGPGPQPGTAGPPARQKGDESSGSE